jgi:hypothetical protein
LKTQFHQEDNSMTQQSEVSANLANSVRDVILDKFEQLGLITSTATAKQVLYLKDFIDDVKTDYQNGDYGALVADGLLATAAIGTGVAVSEIGINLAAGYVLEGVFEVVASFVIAEISNTASSVTKNMMQSSAADAGQTP